MSTRCDIIIKDYGTYEGKHGKYNPNCTITMTATPEGVGAFLIKEVLPKLEKSNNISCDDISNFLIKHEDNEFECTAYNHVDIEYRYIIDIPKKEIRCLKGHYSNLEFSTNKIYYGQEVDLSELRPLRAEELYR